MSVGNSGECNATARLQPSADGGLLHRFTLIYWRESKVRIRGIKGNQGQMCQVLFAAAIVVC